ncbi:MAG TPA: serine/threonine-protein kinase [Kofleriaceae bacterium]|nr:serine/threonine-protein kinase [Kofleriaceae bacterium]
MVADPRNPSGRRPPILPLPPPPDTDEPGATTAKVATLPLHDDPGGTTMQVPAPPRRRRSPTTDVAAELPRLPEVGLHDGSSEVDVDARSLAPGRSSLSVARALPVPPPHPALSRAVKPVTPPRPRRTTGSRSLMNTPRPPPRSANVRVETAEYSSLIGGRYQILSRIGQGGMGKVYKVKHIHLSRTFALKIISNQVAETDEARELFYREARFASAMSHPNITSVVDFGEDEKVGMFMVMEMVDGEALNRILFREKQMTARKACDIVLQVAEALHYIHKQGVVHCDIKTENILISEEEHEGKRSKTVIKLLDFGLARSLTASRASTSLSGTPHYVAPERIRGEPASPASDVYGVGILLYELVTGQVPWDGAVQKILAGHLEELPKSPSLLVEGSVDPALETLILHALAKRPSERHKDMAAFIYELRTVMDMMGFGRRGRQGPAKRVVIEQRAPDARDELARVAFDACRLPLALLTPEGMIVRANPAFARFVMGASVEVEGLPVQSTPLATAWSSAEADLARTLAGSPVRRIIEIDVAAGESRRLLLWLDAVSEDNIVLGVQPLEL